MSRVLRPLPVLSEDDKERFWSKVDVRGPDECWLWTRRLDKDGYGSVWIHGRTLVSHRVAYVSHYDKDPKEMLVMHSCDVTGCCNPNHLRLGTHLDNNRDRESKGRGNPVRGDAHYSRLTPERMARGLRHGTHTKPESIARGHRHGSYTKPESRRCGERHPSRTKPECVLRGESVTGSKLKESDVMLIRTDGRIDRLIAIDYGVSQATINRVKRRKIWAHVP